MIAAPWPVLVGAAVAAVFAVLPAQAGSIADVVAAAHPAVVTVFGVSAGFTKLEPNEDCQASASNRLPIEDFLPLTPVEEAAVEVGVLGSGFFVDPNGLIVTSEHVVAGATEITVEMADGRRLPVQVVGADALSDIAVLAVDAGEPFPTLLWANEQPLRLGEPVIAIGAPHGFAGSVTVGVVSGLDRITEDNDVMPLIQHDADLNLGSSGGPLLDETGRVIGMNTSIFSPDDNSIGLGFAIPVKLVRPIVSALAAGRPVPHGWIGVESQDLTLDLADGLAVPVEEGAVVTSVVPGGPSDTAGLRPGDVVTGVDGEDVGGFRDMLRAVYHKSPGDVVLVDLWSEGEPRELNVTVGRPPETSEEVSLRRQADAPMDWVARLGLTLVDAEPGARVAAVGRGTPASEARLQPDDVILGLGRTPTPTVGALSRQLDRLVADGQVWAALRVQRRKEVRFVPLSLAGLTGCGQPWPSDPAWDAKDGID